MSGPAPAGGAAVNAFAGAGPGGTGQLPDSITDSRTPLDRYSASTDAREGPVGWLSASVTSTALPLLPSTRAAVISAALEPSGQSGVLWVVSPAITLRSRS